MDTASKPEQDDSPGLVDLVVIAMRQWKVLTACAVLGGVLGWAASKILPLKYQSSALVQIDTQARRASGGLGDMAELFQLDAKAETEIELIQSRSVLGTVVDELGLDNGTRSKGLARKLFGKTGRLELKSLRIPEYQPGQDPWTVVAVTGLDSFVLRNPAGTVVLRGVVHEKVETIAGSDTIGIEVARMESEPGEIFQVFKLPRSMAVASLQGALKVVEKGRRTGILQLTFSAGYPDRSAKILSSIAQHYVLQNIGIRSAEAKKTLDFLQRQLPVVKATLDSLEETLNRYRYSQGTVDIGSEARVILEERSDLHERLLSIEQRRQELLRLYREDHPSITALDAQKKELQKAISGSSNQVRRLPLTQQQLEKLSRDVQVTSAMYTALQNNIQQLQVVQGGEVGNARVVDFPEVPVKSSGPGRKLFILAGLAGGAFGGLILVFLLRSFRRGVHELAPLERIGLPVFAQVPFTRSQHKNTKLKGPQSILAVDSPHDAAIESIRGLRTALDVSLQGAQARLVSISGLKSGDGKSFVAQNLAVLFAQTGRQVVLVDGDLRMGQLHKNLSTDNNLGLTDLLENPDGKIDSYLSRTKIPGLLLLSKGRQTSSPSELLSSQLFGEILTRLASTTDLVIVDTPPMLQVSDPLLAMLRSHQSILVLEAGVHSIDAVQEAVRRAKIAGVKNLAAVLNRCDPNADEYGAYQIYGGIKLGTRA